MKSPEINNFLDQTAVANFGRSRTESMNRRSCVTCGKPANEFRDELSRKEYGISGMCQDCQDIVFVEPEE
jgi:uncharacterized CHY-type Zn-finger protein